MKLVINGQSLEVPEHVHTVKDLLLFYKLDKKPAIVEHNRKIIEKPMYDESGLANGDRIEIVHFVGGG